jgi:hypothetical protein
LRDPALKAIDKFMRARICTAAPESRGERRKNRRPRESGPLSAKPLGISGAFELRPNLVFSLKYFDLFHRQSREPAILCEWRYEIFSISSHGRDIHSQELVGADEMLMDHGWVPKTEAQALSDWIEFHSNARWIAE